MGIFRSISKLSRRSYTQTAKLFDIPILNPQKDDYKVQVAPQIPLADYDFDRISYTVDMPHNYFFNELMGKHLPKIRRDLILARIKESRTFRSNKGFFSGIRYFFEDRKREKLIVFPANFFHKEPTFDQRRRELIENIDSKIKMLTSRREFFFKKTGLIEKFDSIEKMNEKAEKMISELSSKRLQLEQFSLNDPFINKELIKQGKIPLDVNFYGLGRMAEPEIYNETQLKIVNAYKKEMPSRGRKFSKFPFQDRRRIDLKYLKRIAIYRVFPMFLLLKVLANVFKGLIALFIGNTVKEKFSLKNQEDKEAYDWKESRRYTVLMENDEKFYEDAVKMRTVPLKELYPYFDIYEDEKEKKIHFFNFGILVPEDINQFST